MRMKSNLQEIGVWQKHISASVVREQFVDLDAELARAVTSLRESPLMTSGGVENRQNPLPSDISRLLVSAQGLGQLANEISNAP